MAGIVYSIGYTAFVDLDALLRTLKYYHISCLIDVRSVPYSQYRPEYNKESFSSHLNEVGISYRNYAQEFGARQTDLQYYNDDYLDFQKFASFPIFRSGIVKVVNGVAKGLNVAIMCAEKDPLDCHRNILVARNLVLAGVAVVDILGENKIESFKDFEDRLLNWFDPNAFMPLFPEEAQEYRESALAKAYAKKNSIIGVKKVNLNSSVF